MAVEIIKSNLLPGAKRDPSTPDPVAWMGKFYAATGEVSNAADASSGSRYHLADIPSQAMLVPELTFFDVANWGFASVRIGTVDDNDAFVSVPKSGGAVHRPVQAGDNKYDLRLYQILGFETDPGAWIGIWAHGIAAATGAGKLRFRIATLQDV